MALVRSDSSEATTRIGRLRANSSSTPFHPQVKTVCQLWASYDLTATTRESCSRLMPADRYSRLGSRGYRMLEPNNALRRTVAPMTPRLAGLLAAAAIATECAILVVGGCSDLPRRHRGVISDPGFHGSARRRWRSRRLRPRLEPGRGRPRHSPDSFNGSCRKARRSRNGLQFLQRRVVRQGPEHGKPYGGRLPSCSCRPSRSALKLSGVN